MGCFLSLLILNSVKTCNTGSKNTPAQVFSYEHCEIFKETVFDRTPLWWLFLSIGVSSNLFQGDCPPCFILQICKQETRTTRKNKITNQRRIYNPANHL